MQQLLAGRVSFRDMFPKTLPETFYRPIDLPLHLPGVPVRPIVRSTASAVVRPDIVGEPG